MKHVVLGRRKLLAEEARGLHLDLKVRSRSTSPLMALYEVEESFDDNNRFEDIVKTPVKARLGDAHIAPKTPVKVKFSSTKKVRGTASASKVILSNYSEDTTEEESNQLKLGTHCHSPTYSLT